MYKKRRLELLECGSPQQKANVATKVIQMDHEWRILKDKLGASRRSSARGQQNAVQSPTQDEGQTEGNYRSSKLLFKKRTLSSSRTSRYDEIIEKCQKFQSELSKAIECSPRKGPKVYTSRARPIKIGSLKGRQR